MALDLANEVASLNLGMAVSVVASLSLGMAVSEVASSSLGTGKSINSRRAGIIPGIILHLV